MNLPALKAELIAVLSSSSNLTAAEKQKLRDRTVLVYPSEYERYLADNTLTDTAANRGKFFIEKTVGNKPPGIGGAWSAIWIEGNERERQATMPAAEPFE